VSKLKAKKPSKVEKRLKCLMYGVAGSGKTTAAIQFPKPVLIDAERGAENDSYVKLLEKQGGVILQTADFEEIVEEVTTLLTEEHDYKTIIIDPMTTVYSNLVDDAAIKTGTEFGRHYGAANTKLKRLLDLLLRLDMNVVITSHEKKEYGADMKVVGSTFDAYKKLDYIFDLVLEIQKRGKDRYAVVRKTRIQSFEELESFPFSYETLADKYGRKVLERNAVIQKLASKPQIKEIEKLVKLMSVSETIVKKWLKAAQASQFSEMETDKIQAFIDKLRKKVLDNKESEEK